MLFFLVCLLKCLALFGIFLSLFLIDFIHFTNSIIELKIKILKFKKIKWRTPWELPSRREKARASGTHESPQIVEEIHFLRAPQLFWALCGSKEESQE